MHARVILFLCFLVPFFSLQGAEGREPATSFLYEVIARENPHQLDTISFAAKRLAPQEMEKVVSNAPGLSDQRRVEQLLQEQKYPEVLAMVWSEKDPERRLQFLRAHAKDNHPILLLELSAEYLKQSPTLHTYVTEASPWFTAGILRTEQDLATLRDDNSHEASRALFQIYFTTLQNLLENAYPDGQEIEEYLNDHQKELTTYTNEKIGQVLSSKANLPSPEWIMYYSLDQNKERGLFFPKETWDQKRREFAQNRLELRGLPVNQNSRSP